MDDTIPLVVSDQVVDPIRNAQQANNGEEYFHPAKVDSQQALVAQYTEQLDHATRYTQTWGVFIVFISLVLWVRFSICAGIFALNFFLFI